MPLKLLCISFWEILEIYSVFIEGKPCSWGAQAYHSMRVCIYLEYYSRGLLSLDKLEKFHIFGKTVFCMYSYTRTY